MASITERKGRYLVRVRRDGFATVTKTFTRRSDGAAWGRKVEVAMEAGTWAPEAQQVPTLREALSEYRTTVAPRMKGASTYAYSFEQFASLAFAAKRIDEITPFDLAAWRDDMAASLKSSTVARKLGLMGAVFTWAVRERGWLAVSPMARVSKPKMPDGRSRVLSEAEEVALLTAAQTSQAAWLAPALTVLMRTAMRRGELFKLQRADVDFGAATAQLHETKNGTPRKVPLCPLALAALRVLDAAAGVRGGVALLPMGDVCSISTRFTRTVARARKAYEQDCSTAGVECDPCFLMDVHLHDLRHGAVTMWASTGGLSLMELMAVSGHKSPRQLARYTHLDPSALAGKLATLTEQATTPLAVAC